MSRYSQSPSPGAAPPRGRRAANADYDDRFIGRSRSGPRGNVRGRGAYLPPRSQSRSRSLEGEGERFASPPREAPPGRQRRHRRAHAEPPEYPDDRGPAPRQRGEMRRGERPRPTRGDGGDLGGDEPREKRGRGDRAGRERGGGERDARKMQEAQQAQMRAMMGGMMGGMNPAAMQMAMMQQMGHMGMVHPGYMQMMQQQQMMMGRKKQKAPGGSSSDSDSGSSSDSGAPNGVMNPAAAMAAMAAMHQQQGHWPASASGMPPPQGEYKPPPHVPGMPPPPPPPPPPPGTEGYQPPGSGDGDNAEPTQNKGSSWVEIPKDAVLPARRSAKAQIEAMIDTYRLTVGVAWTMRAMPPDKQKLAAKIDPSGQADPSGYVAEELKNIV